jgi:hypothetical protein
MASEDSASRDGFRRFVVSAIAAILARPPIVGWSPLLIIVTTEAKLMKFTSFGRSKWVCFEEWHDAILQLAQAPDAVAPHVLAMVVVPAVDRNHTTPEELLECVKYRNASLSLNDRELRLDLPAQAARSILEDRDAKTSLAVDKADDPLRS